MSESAPAGAPAIDLTSTAAFNGGHPWDQYAWLRAHDPVHWHPERDGPGFWAVTRYNDVRHVLRTPQDFSSWLGATQIRDPDPADLPFIRRMILNMDPPEQLRLRRLVTPAFTRRRLEGFADVVRARAAALLAAVAAAPSVRAGVAEALPQLKQLNDLDASEELPLFEPLGAWIAKQRTAVDAYTPSSCTADAVALFHDGIDQYDEIRERFLAWRDWGAHGHAYSLAAPRKIATTLQKAMGELEARCTG
jgi:hypothetical protein